MNKWINIAVTQISEETTPAKPAKSDLDKVNTWLDFIGEDDEQCRREVLETCRDPEGLEYFLMRYRQDVKKEK